MTDAISFLFLFVAAIAVISAIAMLLTSNAVHSAMFLIVVMGCIAFMFLMLDAPFLFLVQITVYAGAIMVLFLFVIMLLGAERVGGRSPVLRWMTPVAMVLSLIFLSIAGLALQSDRGVVSSAGADPLVRVAHFATDAGPVDVYANNELLVENLSYGENSPYLAVSPGEYNLALFAAGTDQAVYAVTLSLEPGVIGTAVAYGEGRGLALSLIPDDLGSLSADETGRLVVFNAHTRATAPVALVDLGSDLDPNDDQIILDAVAVGAFSDAVELSDRTDMRTWAFVAGDNILFRLRDPQTFRITADSSHLLVLATERLFDGSSRARAFPLVEGTLPTFGGPVAVGRELFTRYLLPMQMVAVLLLVAMIGAIVLTHKPDYTPRRRRDERRRVSRPLTSVIAAQTGHEVMTPENGNGAARQPLPLPQPDAESQTGEQ